MLYWRIRQRLFQPDCPCPSFNSTFRLSISTQGSLYHPPYAARFQDAENLTECRLFIRKSMEAVSSRQAPDHSSPASQYPGRPDQRASSLPEIDCRRKTSILSDSISVPVRAVRNILPDFRVPPVHYPQLQPIY